MPVFLMTRLPLLLLLAQMVVVLLANDPFHTPPVRQPDTDSYLEYGHQNLLDVLSHSRTPLYPMLLHYGKEWTGGLDGLPAFQHLLHFLAVGVFWWGLRRFGFRPWIALVAASPLLYGEMARFFASSILTDSPSLSLSVLSMGLLLNALARPASLGGWGGWGVAVFLAYLLRPSYMFLIPLGILLGVILWPLRPGETRRPAAPPFFSMLKRLVVVALAPFLLYATFRWMMVGHFGLVSFGGSLAIGVSAQLIDPPTVARLPERLQPLARDIMAERDRRHLTPPFSKLGWIRYGPWVEEYNINLWQIGFPLAMVATDQNNPKANALLAELSREIFRARPTDYAHWLGTAFMDAIQVVLRHQRALQVILALLLPVCVAGMVQRGLPSHRDSPPLPTSPSMEREVAVMGAIALLFFLVGTALVILVSPPLERYTFANAHFLPSLAALLLLVCGHGISWRNRIAAPPP